MPSLIDLLTQNFNGMFDPAPAAGYQQSPQLAQLMAAMQPIAMRDRAPGLQVTPTTVPRNGPTLADNWNAPPPAPLPATGIGGPAGAASPPSAPAAAPPMNIMPQTQGSQQASPGGLRNWLAGPKGDALMGLFAGWAQGGTLGESLGAGGAGAVAGMKQGRRNQTLQAFLDNQPNMDPATKEMLAADPELAKQYIAGIFKMGQNDPAAVQEYKFAQGQGFKGGYLDFLNAKNQASGGGDFGKTPVYGQDESGNVVMGVIGPNGQFVASPPPSGVRFMGPGGTAEARAFGTKTGEAKANIGVVENAGKRLIQSIDDVLNDPGLSRVTGPVQSWLPNVSGEANRAQSRLDQIQGATFLQAYNDLRGGGQITEAEGSKATAAYNRLAATGMSDADYRNALREFRSEVQKLIVIAKQRAAAGGSTPAPNPQGSGVIDYKDFF